VHQPTDVAQRLPKLAFTPDAKDAAKPVATAVCSAVNRSSRAAAATVPKSPG